MPELTTATRPSSHHQHKDGGCELTYDPTRVKGVLTHPRAGQLLSLREFRSLATALIAFLMSESFMLTGLYGSFLIRSSQQTGSDELLDRPSRDDIERIVI